MAASLLTTKLYIPPVRSELVSRPHLLGQLNAGLARKLVLVSAPAGFGKTMLLSEWVQVARAQPGASLRVAWLSLDESDNDPTRFFAYFFAALQTAQAGLDGAPPRAPQSAQPAALEELLTGLINQVSAPPGEWVLVLDDYHLVTSQLIHDALAFLLDHLPSNMHLVVATRADPPLPIARLRGRGQLVELRQSDLRFTPEEAIGFLNACMGLNLSPDTVSTLTSLTEGWIAGLQMAALSMQGKKDLAGFVSAFAGSHRYVLDYLLEEVLYREPPEMQAFLLQTSVLDRLCGSLCDAVFAGQVGDAGALTGQSALEYLERANLFIIPLDDHREWYRYHRLFADLLRIRLQQARPDLVKTLHRRASQWYQGQGLLGGAIDHALAAEDPVRAADLIEEDIEETLMRGEVATFLRRVEALPDELVRARPSLCFYHAWVLLLVGRPRDVIESRLQEIDGESEILRGRIAALRALMAIYRGQVGRAIALARQALEELPDEDRFIHSYATWILNASQLHRDGRPESARAIAEVFQTSQQAGNVMLAAMVACNQAELYMRQGQLGQAAATYRRALELTTDGQGRRLPLAGQALLGLGDLAREWNDLEAASRYLTESIQLTEQWSEVGALEAYLALGRIRQAQGDMEAAWRAISKAQELAVKFDVTEIDDLVVAMVRARLWIAEGDLDAAQHWAEEQGLHQYIGLHLEERDTGSLHRRLLKYELLVLARLLIAQKQQDEALILLKSLLPLAERRRRPGMIIEIHVLEALALQARNDLNAALVALQEAVRAAEPEGYTRVFVDEGDAMKKLLSGAAARNILPGQVGRLLSAFAAEGQRSEETGERAPPAEPLPVKTTATLVEPLSERELEVLRLLTTHLSSTEIAEHLGITSNTARFHIKNIYGKLNVHRRSDAVDRARELELL